MKDVTMLFRTELIIQDRVEKLLDHLASENTIVEYDNDIVEHQGREVTEYYVTMRNDPQFILEFGIHIGSECSTYLHSFYNK